jgi:hypothetical protein
VKGLSSVSMIRDLAHVYIDIIVYELSLIFNLYMFLVPDILHVYVHVILWDIFSYFHMFTFVRRSHFVTSLFVYHGFLSYHPSFDRV